MPASPTWAGGPADGPSRAVPRRPRSTPDGSGEDSRSSGAPGHTRAERRAWLSKLKEDAVRQLPPSASPAVRAQLRLDVDHALRHHGPDDPVLELQDILSALVSAAARQLNEVEQETRRSQRKTELTALARETLAAALDECPSYLVGAAGSSKRTHALRAVWADLRAILDKTLLGTESEEGVEQRVEEHVAQWRHDHDRWWRPRLPSPVQVVKGIKTATMIVDTVNKTPELRQLAETITQAASALLRQRRQSKEPPPSSS